MKPSLAQKAAGVVHITGPCAPPGVDDDAEITGCCDGEVMRGPAHCTCWQPIFDLEQQPLENDGHIPLSYSPDTRAKCCGDCAYRTGSPERSDEWEEEALLDLPHQEGHEFWCHQGVRRAIAYRHPDGRVLPAGDGDYQPPQTVTDGGRGIIWKADGTPGERCAGWAALRS